MTSAPLSIVIPTLNAMPRLIGCLSALVEGLSAGLVRDVTIVDAGSSDTTRDLALDMGCRVVECPPEARGRGHQLAMGAQHCQGEWLLFLHADSLLQAGWIEAIEAHIAQAPNKAGYFVMSFDDDSSGARRTAFWANWRALRFGLPYGDQGLLMLRSHYDAIGGYRALPLMEDVDLVRKIGKHHLRRLPAMVITSADKYRQGGWWRTSIRNMALLMTYFLGVQPARFKDWYR
ncbi:TIGR04283 family arsenosugar biosynthesis glycosyltransferase [Candidatus Phycosocius spiralis]|uniref:Glycosyl transferase n=1 Tax=Candidatus Phycosocius spiralis TaxID=2815099 RepID=A0ABQ4PVJ4_9PROT|nr:TIGR04283 family arsenosugar biosynthesis glycosyltransferase [Candidatus Phycosocius spiralis]GIU66950.1 glycosyl transferase [Candidatus Phycosocius spiralis]